MQKSQHYTKKAIKVTRLTTDLSNINKAYEKCLLAKLDLEIDDVGCNQHGFRKHHPTETALLTLQSLMSSKIEEKVPTIQYSVDLSEAFDLLRPDKFNKMFKDTLTEGMHFALCDFLTKFP